MKYQITIGLGWQKVIRRTFKTVNECELYRINLPYLPSQIIYTIIKAKG